MGNKFGATFSVIRKSTLFKIMLLKNLTKISEGSGSNFFDPGQPFLVWVWIWKFSPKNPKFSIFCPSGQEKCYWVGSKSTGVKGGSASYLLQVKSMLGSGPISSQDKSDG